MMDSEKAPLLLKKQQQQKYCKHGESISMMFSLDLQVKYTLSLPNFTGSKPSAPLGNTPPFPHYSDKLHKLDKVGEKTGDLNCC